jgi:hypothetical protein
VYGGRSVQNDHSPDKHQLNNTKVDIMPMLKKILGSVVMVSALGGGLLYYDIQRKQVYPCQSFCDTAKQYFTLATWKGLSSKQKVSLVFHPSSVSIPVLNLPHPSLPSTPFITMDERRPCGTTIHYL